MTTTEFRPRCCRKATLGNKIHNLDGSNFADTFSQGGIPGLGVLQHRRLVSSDPDLGDWARRKFWSVVIPNERVEAGSGVE
jgi:hypothetical protein